MGAIYMFRNKINSKVYIGKTERSDIELRYNEHIYRFMSGAYREHNSILYYAFEKYGLHNFEFSILFQSNDESIDWNRLEMDYIKLYNSNDRNYGYNLTVGGDGKKYKYLPEQSIIERYKNGDTLLELGRVYMVDPKTIKDILLKHNIRIRDSREACLRHTARQVEQLDSNGNVLNSFESVLAAQRFFNKPKSCCIMNVLRGRNKTAYGYYWRYKC